MSKMIFVELIPNYGLKGIPFGTPKEEARKLVANLFGDELPELSGTGADSYFNAALQLDYEDETLSYIEVYGGGPVYATLYGIETWTIPGTELIKRIKEREPLDEELSKNDDPFFRDGKIAFWDLDEQYDDFGGYKTPKWGSIGIGDSRYYEAICRIKNKQV